MHELYELAYSGDPPWRRLWQLEVCREDFVTRVYCVNFDTLALGDGFVLSLIRPAKEPSPLEQVALVPSAGAAQVKIAAEAVALLSLSFSVPPGSGREEVSVGYLDRENVYRRQIFEVPSDAWRMDIIREGG